jgi:hypothetical protein
VFEWYYAAYQNYKCSQQTNLRIVEWISFAISLSITVILGAVETLLITAKPKNSTFHLIVYYRSV